MSPVDLRQRVESAILDMLDTDAWNHARTIEQVEVASMREFQQHWKDSKSRLGAICPGTVGGAS